MAYQDKRRHLSQRARCHNSYNYDNVKQDSQRTQSILQVKQCLWKRSAFYKVRHHHVPELTFRLLYAHAFRQVSVSYKSFRIFLPKFQKLHLVKFSKAFYRLPLSLRLIDEILWVYHSAVWTKFTPGHPSEFFEFRKSQDVFIRDPVDCSSDVQVFKTFGAA